MKANDKWQIVEKKMAELRRLVKENWDKGEWELAMLGQDTLKTVEQSKVTAEEMRQQANTYIETIKKIWPTSGCHSPLSPKDMPTIVIKLIPKRNLN